MKLLSLCLLVALALHACNGLLLNSVVSKKGKLEGGGKAARVKSIHATLSAATARRQVVLASSIADQVSTVDATWADLTANGEKLTSMTKMSLFFRSLAAGVFTGFGGCLCASVGFDMALKPWEAGSGIARLVTGVVGMPLAFLLINITGNGAWTGDALSVARAYLKNRKAMNALRMLCECFVNAL